MRRAALLFACALAAAATVLVTPNSLTPSVDGGERGERPAGGEGVLAIVGGDVHTVAGPVLRRGTVICRDGKIAAVGVDLKVPEGARVIDAKGKRVLPGFIAPRGNNFGIRPGRPRAGEKYADCLDADSIYAELALSVGITAYFGTGFNRSLYSDANAIVKPALGRPDLMIVKEPAALVVGWANRAASERAAFRESLAATRKWIDAGRKGRAPAKSSVIAALDRSLPTRISASTRRDIRHALDLARDFDLHLVIDGATEAWTMPEDVASAGATVIVAPRARRWPSPGREGRSGSSIEAPALLEKAGVRFCLLPPGGFGGPGHAISLQGVVGRDLLTYPIEGAFAIRGGASADACLRAITLTAAEALGVDDRLGSIERGKDADLVIYDGDPFDYRAFADVTIVSGHVLYERSKSTLFSHLDK